MDLVYALKIDGIIKFEHLSNPESSDNKEPTRFYLDEKIISDMRSEGKTAAYISIHSTNLDINEFFSPSPLLNIVKEKGATILPIKFDPLIIKRPVIHRYFEDVFKLEAVSSSVFASGKYLALLVLFTEAKHITGERPDIIDRIINSIRLTKGIGSAGKTVFEGQYDDVNRACMIVSPLSYQFPEETNHGNDVSSLFNFSKNIEINDFLLNPDADVLFNRAIAENDPGTRFLFLWLCFECMIKGKERIALFRDKLSSTVANDEVYRLFNVRNNIAHEGRVDASLEDCTSVLWAIRIAVCPDEATQKEMCAKYEEWIG